MNGRYKSLLLVMGLSLLIGCNQETDRTSTSQPQNSPPTDQQPDPDDAAAVEGIGGSSDFVETRR